MGAAVMALMGGLYGFDRYSYSHSKLEGFHKPPSAKEIGPKNDRAREFMVPADQAAEIDCGKYNRALNLDLEIKKEVIDAHDGLSLVSCSPDAGDAFLFGGNTADLIDNK